MTDKPPADETHQVCVTAINRAHGVVLLSDDTTAAITHFLDANGKECGPDDAITLVAGPDVRGLFHSIDLTDFVKWPTQ